MSPRERAQIKQQTKGNAPEDTRLTNEELLDFGRYRTGKVYREWLEIKLLRQER